MHTWKRGVFGHYPNTNIFLKFRKNFFQRPKQILKINMKQYYLHYVFTKLENKVFFLLKFYFL